ncbi:MAG: hypothetical protein IPH88_08250 [Bacteroidales bacterium]|nr:hypothetical protein [Bacteroidales bacterium]
MKKTIPLIFLLALTLNCLAQKKQMSKAFYQHDFDKALLLADEILKENPKDIDANLGAAKSWNGKIEYANAIPYLTIILENANEDWQFAWANIEMMKALYGLGQLQKAGEYYAKAKACEGTASSGKELKYYALLFGFDEYYSNWKTVESENIIFHFQDTSDTKRIQFTVKSRQEAFEKTTAYFGSTLPKKVDFFVWNTRQNYNEILKLNLGFSNSNYCVSHNRTGQSPGHELAHVISFWTNKDKKINHFINEGIAVCFDWNNNDKMAQAREAYKQSNFDLVKCWKGEAKYDNGILYPIAGAFIEYLKQIDNQKLLALNNDQSYENARLIYSDMLDIIIEQFYIKLRE